MAVMPYIILLVQFGTICVGGFRFRSLPLPLKILEYLLCFAFGMTVIELILAYESINNLWVVHISTIIEFITILFIFSFWMQGRIQKKIIFASMIGFSLFWIISKFMIEPFTQFDGWTSSVAKVTLIIFSAYIFIEVIKDNELDWTKDPRFWVTAGIIIYSAGSLFLFALFNRMLQISSDKLMMIWLLNWFLIIITNVIYSWSFLCRK